MQPTKKIHDVASTIPPSISPESPKLPGLKPPPSKEQEEIARKQDALIQTPEFQKKLDKLFGEKRSRGLSAPPKPQSLPLTDNLADSFSTVKKVLSPTKLVKTASKILTRKNSSDFQLFHQIIFENPDLETVKKEVAKSFINSLHASSFLSIQEKLDYIAKGQTPLMNGVSLLQIQHVAPYIIHNLDSLGAQLNAPECILDLVEKERFQKAIDSLKTAPSLKDFFRILNLHSLQAKSYQELLEKCVGDKKVKQWLAKLEGPDIQDPGFLTLLKQEFLFAKSFDLEIHSYSYEGSLRKDVEEFLMKTSQITLVSQRDPSLQNQNAKFILSSWGVASLPKDCDISTKAWIEPPKDRTFTPLVQCLCLRSLYPFQNFVNTYLNSHPFSLDWTLNKENNIQLDIEILDNIPTKEFTMKCKFSLNLSIGNLEIPIRLVYALRRPFDERVAPTAAFHFEEFKCNKISKEQQNTILEQLLHNLNM